MSRRRSGLGVLGGLKNSESISIIFWRYFRLNHRCLSRRGLHAHLSDIPLQKTLSRGAMGRPLGNDTESGAVRRCYAYYRAPDEERWRALDRLQLMWFEKFTPKGCQGLFKLRE